MTVRQILKMLAQVPENKLDLPFIAIHGASGVSYEVDSWGTVRQYETGTFEAGVLCDFQDGQEYVSASLD